MANVVTVIATSRVDEFVGAVGGTSSLFVGLLNGTVLMMDPSTGQLMGSVTLPDGNSAAHLTYYDGSLYVGTEWLASAKDQPPFHIYKIDPTTMKIVAQIPMEAHYANGFVLPFNGFLWAGDGHCTLYKIDAKSLIVVGTVPGVAEDEMTFDGANYWAECVSTVNVLKQTAGVPYTIASRSLPYPDRPRGFFIVNSALYSSGSLDSKLYSMALSGNSIVLKSTAKVSGTMPTRDTVQYGGLTYAYETGPGADLGQLPARISVYDSGFGLVGVVPLPGPALSLDASQHSLFAFGGRLYFVTESSIGHLDTANAGARSTTGGASIPMASQMGAVQAHQYIHRLNVRRLGSAA